MVSRLPSSLSEWVGAESIAEGIDVEELRAAIEDIVDHVLAEDCVVLDSLPEDVEISAVTPLGILAGVYEDDAGVVELVVAARLVRRSFDRVPGFDQCSDELRAKVWALPG